MPGHERRSGNEPDPDPTDFLFISYEEKQKDLAKPYDPKKSCWYPLKEGGFAEGVIESAEGDKVVVRADGERKALKKDQVQQVNPPKFERCEDMSNLTYLNEASVLHNLKARYVSKLIYTYSGLFCVAINPYKRFPIYTPTVVKIYFGKRRNEVPPHIFAIADGAYQNMINHGKNQSILVTGESGAGKTENTKKVIGYFAEIAANEKSKKSGASLEDRIVQTNPVLEAFGNAKTVKNDNSSRFGKFIRIHFNQFGKVSGADMEVYLLEKSRITYQQTMERSYHIFYNIMSNALSTLKKDCCLSNDIHDYHFVSQGKVSVESIDDKEDMMFVDEAFDILGFTKGEKTDIYKLTAAVMQLGELKFKKKSSKDDQAEADEEKAAKNIAKLVGINHDILYDNFVRPKIKVGAEWVTKGQNTAQAYNAVSGIARAIFEKQFRYLVDKCNETLVDASMKRISFIGVLDIAGFEIFEFNGFEQMCINFCNEKLQQFFNHHMFVLEQEEYMKEGIEWAMVDFGMDLQNCIDMFEKPMGILSILEEESLFPKATDKSFEEKLKNNHLGKSSTFVKPKNSPDKDAHFAIIHYAGTVNYNITNWLEKNKDPVNDSVIDVMKNCPNETLRVVLKDMAGHSTEDQEPGKKKKGGGKTVSAFYKDQLHNLMTTLHSTEPHFIRCVVPNTHKAAGVIDSILVMHQLTCNGVLEGIRICRKGFPNRMIYKDFQHRYSILNPSAVADAMKNEATAKLNFANEEKMNQNMALIILKTAGLEKEKYRLGHTKVFFRAGVLGMMEEVREERVTKVISWLQSTGRGALSRLQFRKLKTQKIALLCVQRAIRNFMAGKHWLWWKLWLSVKPELRCFKFAEIKENLEAKRIEAESKINAEKAGRKSVEVINTRLEEEKKALEDQLAHGAESLKDVQSKVTKIEAAKKQLEAEYSSCTNKLNDEEEANNMLSNSLKKLRIEKKKKEEDTEMMELRLTKAKEDSITKDTQIKSLKEELTHQDELIEKLQKEKKNNADGRQKIDEDLQAAEDKSNHLTRIKNKLEQSLDELEDSVERERKSKSESEKLKKKSEIDLRLAQETVSDLEKNRSEVNVAIQMKEKEFAAIQAKIDDEQSLGSKMQKQIKGLINRLEELEGDLEGERNSRAKAEKTRHTISREIEELSEKLEESGNATAAAMEVNKKREAELFKLKQELDDSTLQHETNLANLRQKHNSIISELGDQIDQLNKNKAKLEQSKNMLLMELNQSRHTLEDLNLEKANIDKNNKMMQNDISEASNRLEDMYQTLNEADTLKKRLSTEKADLEKQIQDGENEMRNLSKLKTSLTTQLDDMKRLSEAESRDKALLVGKFKALESDIESIREKIEEENAAKADFQRQLSRAAADTQIWKSKYTTEALARIEDLESAKSKLLARINEAEECIEGLGLKVNTTEKIRNRYQMDLEDLQLELERVNSAISVADKKLKNYDAVINEWRIKCDDIGGELEASQRECRNLNSEVFRLKAAWDEGVENLDAVRRENKNLAEEIKDLLDQLGEGGKSIHELDRQRRRLQVEKEELQSALEEAESALEQEENKVTRAALDLQQIKQEVERRLQEKDEEFETTRKNFQRTIDSLQASLDAEVKAKQEALRVKKKIEADINELEMCLDHANKANAEDSKQIKRYTANLMEVESQIQEEARLRSDLEDKAGIAERKGNALTGEVEETRMLLDTADRARKAAESELQECRESISDLGSANNSLMSEKRRLEGIVRGLQQEIDDLLISVKNSDEKSKKAIGDASRLAEELRSEQEHGLTADRLAKSSQAQCAELQGRLEEAEAVAASYGRKMIVKLEEKIRMLEAELGTTQIRSAETHKNALRADRRIREMEFQSEEDKKKFNKLGELTEKLQDKTRTYKKQIEDAEEIAALNLAKFRKAQQQLEEAEERSSSAENLMGRVRMDRAASMARYNGY